MAEANLDTPLNISHAERRQREDLAACFRLAAHFGWDDLIFTHFSARVPGSDSHFLINPRELMFEEITASDLVKIDVDGNPVGENRHTAPKAGFVIHSAIHMNRHDAHCVLHLHGRDGTALATTRDGLLPMTQTAMLIAPHIAFHEFEGVALRLEERERLCEDLGDKPLMILRNHGTLGVGRTVAEAFFRMYQLEWSAGVQIRALASGMTLHHPADDVVSATGQVMGLDMAQGLTNDVLWPALIRLLDRKGSDFRL